MSTVSRFFIEFNGQQYPCRFGPGTSYACDAQKLFGYSTEEKLRRAIGRRVIALNSKKAKPVTP